MLRFENVSFRYQNSNEPIIKDLSFAAETGSFTALIGASGSGKTTLFRLINKLETPECGSILVNDTNIRQLKNYTSYMPQQDLLFPWLTVEENVMLPMTVQRVAKAEKKERARQMLKQVGLLEWADKKPAELSGGMRQRVAFARTLCVGADILLLDEPFSALDSITRIGLQEWLLEQWRQLGKTILFITHDVEEAIYLSQRILVLTGRPVTKAEEYVVPCQTDRTRQMLTHSDVINLKEQLIAKLQHEAERNAAAQSMTHADEGHTKPKMSFDSGGDNYGGY